MRLAVVTSQFPSRVSTFFSRDMRALLAAGFDVEILPIYPLNNALWRYVPDILNEGVLSRDKVHHLGILRSLWLSLPLFTRSSRHVVRQVAELCGSAASFGIEQLAKTLYVIPKGAAWARLYPTHFDHILAYWGNYAGSCAYVFNQLLERKVPFSIFLHAGTDLYRDRIFLREKLLAAETIITCTNFNRHYLQDIYPDISEILAEKIHVYYHGLDFSEFTYGSARNDSRRVIAVGKFSKMKGFDNLLLAAHKLLGRGIELEIELVGDGPQARNLMGLAENLGIQDRVNFRGWLPFTEVRNAMKDATILVHPSTGLGDGLPNVIREAMALGTAVVASDVAGIHEALDAGRCGVLVPPRDIDALGDAIQKLLDDDGLRIQLADSARTYAEEHFDLWTNGQELASVLSYRPDSVNEISSRLTV